MLFILALLITITILVVIHYASQSRKHASLAKIKGPKPLPFIGNVLEFGTNPADILHNQMKMIDTYGATVKYWIGSQLFVMITEPEHMEQVLGSSVHIEKSLHYEFLKEWLGENSLVVSQGKHWRTQRKHLGPAFHFKMVQEYLFFVNKNAKILHEKFAKRVGDKSVNVHQLLKLYTLDIISEAAMNKSVNAQNDANCEYAKAVETVFSLIMKRLFSVIGHIDFIYKRTTDYKEFLKHIQSVKKFTGIVLADKKEKRANNVNSNNETQVDEFSIKPKKSFIELLLDLKDGENMFTDKEIEDQVETFMFAGEETLASTLSFSLYELSKRPDVQKRLVEESNSILGTDTDCEISYDVVNDMKFLECCVKECIRLYSAVPFIERQLTEEIVIDGATIPPGTIIQPFFLKLHRNEKYYPNPDKFDPERFTLENSRYRHPYAFLPFSAGPRNCIGFRYALLVTKTTLIGILRKFEVLPAEPHFEPILSNAGTLGSTNGINVQLKKR